MDSHPKPPPERDRDARSAYRGLGVRSPHFVLAHITAEDLPWHETEDELERAKAEAAHRAELMVWVRRTMRGKLSNVERDALKAILDGLNYREAGAKLGCSPSTANRAVRRAIRKLRAAARNRVATRRPSQGPGKSGPTSP